MRVTLLQRNVIWADPQKNAAANTALMESIKGTDLFVLPEMFSTGFATEPDGIAEPLNEKGECFTLKWMKQMSEKLQCAIAGSVAVKDQDGRFFNRMYFVSENGCFSYDKHHLFTYGGENRHYNCGAERVVVYWKGVKILLQVCYDVRFPVFSRNMLVTNEQGNQEAEYDAIIYVASWPAKRIVTWQKLLPARAIENQCYVLAVNRVGEDPSCGYVGGTMVIDAMGNIVASCPDSEEAHVSFDLDMAALEKFRSKFPVLRDADVHLPPF